MSRLYSSAVRWRRLVARRPSIHWWLVTACALAAGASVRSRIDEIDEQRRAWGDRRSVVISSAAADVGEAIDTVTVEVPASMVPIRALDPSTADGVLIARHALAENQIVTALDIGRQGTAGPMAIVPDGWLAVAVVESPASGAAPGDAVTIASDGLVLAEGIVVGHHETATLVAVPAAQAPLLPAAADRSLALLRQP
jgi:hypothetical protein